MSRFQRGAKSAITHPVDGRAFLYHVNPAVLESAWTANNNLSAADSEQVLIDKQAEMQSREAMSKLYGPESTSVLQVPWPGDSDSRPVSWKWG